MQEEGQCRRKASAGGVLGGWRGTKYKDRLTVEEGQCRRSPRRLERRQSYKWHMEAMGCGAMKVHEAEK